MAFLSRLAALFRKRELDRRVDQEMLFHLEMQIEENIRRGMSPQEARRQARIAGGGLEQAKELHRDARGLPFLESLLQDIRFALRSFRKAPTFTATVLLTLALGIGVGTAIFSIINAVLLKPMPYRDPDRVVMLWNYSERVGLDLKRVRAGGVTMGAAEFLDRKRLSQSFENMAALRVRNRILASEEGAEQRMNGFAVSDSFFETLGVLPIMGRAFEPNEYIGDSDAIILQHSTWRTRFGADPDIIGKEIQFHYFDAPHRVVGVMPEGFAIFDRSVELFSPLDLRPWLNRPREYTFFTVVARLRDGFSVEQAQAEANLLTQQFARQYPNRQYEYETSVVIPIADDSTSDIAGPLRILFAAVGLVMLIVCANTASLLLGRASARTREIAVRSAIGAGKLRMVRQLLTESLALSLLGAAAGFGLAHLIVRHFQAIVPNRAGWGRALVHADWIAIDGVTAAFAIGISILAGLVFGILPALQAARTDPNVALKDAGAAGSSRRSRTRSLLVVVETALAVVLVCSAGLLVRSFIALHDEGPGFRAERRMSMLVELQNTPSAERLQELNGIQNLSEARRFRAETIGLRNQSLLERLAALPGVRGVATASQVMTDQNASLYFWVFRDGGPPSQPCEAFFRYVSPNYFQLLSIPLLEGRGFDERDTFNAEPVMVVSPQLVRSCFGDQRPVDARVQFSGETATAPNYRVIGVVDDLHEEGIDRDPLAVVYISTFQRPFANFRLIVHADSDPIALLPGLQKTIRDFDVGDTPTRFGEIYRLEDLVRDSAWKLNYSTFMLGSLAGLALLLAAIGVYGVLSQTVRQRTREIGLRMALGAERSEVQRMIVRQGLKPVALGLVLGLTAAAAVTRFLGSLLYGVEPLDPPTFIAVVAVLLGAAWLASYIPARRAAQVDPMAALRHE